MCDTRSEAGFLRAIFARNHKALSPAWRKGFYDVSPEGDKSDNGSDQVSADEADD